MGLTRTASTGGPGGLTRERTRSKRGEKRNESNKVGNTSQSHVMPMHNQHAVGFELVAPLQVTANRWDRKAFQADADSSEVIHRKVKGLLNKLTMEKFDSIPIRSSNGRTSRRMRRMVGHLSKLSSSCLRKRRMSLHGLRCMLGCAGR